MTTATRKNLNDALVTTETVAASNTVRQGAPVALSSGAVVEAVAIGAAVIGIAYVNEDGDWPATAGQRVQVVRLGSPVIIPVLAGDGFTKGQFVRPKLTAGGASPATFASGGATITIIGQAVDTVAAGELGGVNVAATCTTFGS